MITLNSVFDNIYCINLDRRPDRWQKCVEEFDRIDITVERFRASDGNEIICDGQILPGEKGIYLTHLRIAEDAIKNRYDKILILEDDVKFSDNFVEDFDSWYREVPNDWNMLYLGANMVGWVPTKGTYSPHVVNGYHLFAAHALGLDVGVLEDLYFSVTSEMKQIPFSTEWYEFGPESKLTLDQPVDIWYANNSVWYKSYLMIPRMAWQREDYSDIQNENVDYIFLRQGQWGIDS